MNIEPDLLRSSSSRAWTYDGSGEALVSCGPPTCLRFAFSWHYPFALICVLFAIGPQQFVVEPSAASDGTKLVCLYALPEPSSPSSDPRDV